MRYLDPFIKKDLGKKMVLLSGPRQVGKTHLSKSLYREEGCEYLNWDVLKHRKAIKAESWNQASHLLVLDEIHKRKSWKNFLKGIVDQKSGQKILVTGSANLETFRKSGDALTGRYFHYRLFPFDFPEAQNLTHLKSKEIIDRLLLTGGFPEPFFNPEDADRLRKNRIEQVFQEDLRELSQVHSLKSLQYLVDLLRERVGSTVNFSNLATDLDVSPPTVKSWIGHLERLYLVFSIPPYSKKIKRSLRKDKKYFFYDCSLAGAPGGRFENLTAMTLLKFCHFNEDTRGGTWRLYYFRDKQKREVDFVVERNGSPYWVIEAKARLDSFNKGILYLKEKLPTASFFQISLAEHKRERIHGIEKMSLARFSENYLKTE